VIFRLGRVRQLEAAGQDSSWHRCGSRTWSERGSRCTNRSGRRGEHGRRGFRSRWHCEARRRAAS
jgi:hypothetical protein